MSDTKKKNIIFVVGGIIVIGLIILLCVILFNKKSYNVFLEINMPKDSYGYVTYTPGNNSEFNLYKNSYLNLEYSFSDKKDRDVKYIIENEDIVTINNDRLTALSNGTTKVYVITDDKVKSNVITIRVVDEDD